MPWEHVIWTEDALRKIEEHGVTVEEVEWVLEHPNRRERSRSSGLPLVKGRTSRGRRLCVIYVRLDTITVEPITAYPLD